MHIREEQIIISWPSKSYLFHPISLNLNKFEKNTRTAETLTQKVLCIFTFGKLNLKSERFV